MKDYGCKNCKWHKVYKGDYWTPDEHECVIPKNMKPLFPVTEEDEDEIFTRVWENGEEWDRYWEQICPYYKEHIIDDRY